MSSTKEKNTVPNQKKKAVSRKFLEELRRRQLRRRRIMFTTLGTLVLLLILILCYSFGVYEKLLDAFGVERDISVEPSATEISYVPRGEYVLGAADGCVIVYDENGVTGLDRNGTWKWNVSCSVETPVMNCYGSFLLLSDYNGQTVWAFDGTGQRWRYDSEMPVVGAFASSSGDALMVLCSQEDFETSVTYLTCDGGMLTEVFTRKFGTYYMIAGDRSDNKEQMALSGVYSSGGELTGSVVFMRVRDGEVFSTEVTEGQAYPMLSYLNEEVVFAANAESLRLMRKSGTASQSSDQSKEIWSRNGGRTVIADAICVNGKYCVVAFRDENTQESSSTVSSLVYYNSAGEKKKEIQVEGAVRGVLSSDQTVLVYTDRSVLMFSDDGGYIGTYTVQADIETVAYIDRRNVMVSCQSGMVMVSFEE